MEHLLFWMIPVSSLLALLLAWYFYRQMMKESEGTPVMQKIASHVRQGAMSYLKQQYKIVGLVFWHSSCCFRSWPTASTCKTRGYR